MAKLNKTALGIFKQLEELAKSKIEDRSTSVEPESVIKNCSLPHSEVVDIKKSILTLENNILSDEKLISEYFNRSRSNVTNSFIFMWGAFLFDTKHCSSLDVISANYNEFCRIVSNQNSAFGRKFNCYVGSDSKESTLAETVGSLAEAEEFKLKKEENWIKASYTFDFGRNFRKTLLDNNLTKEREVLVFIQTMLFITEIFKESNKAFNERLCMAKILVEADLKPSSDKDWFDLIDCSTKLHDLCTNKAGGLLAISRFAELIRDFKE